MPLAIVVVALFQASTLPAYYIDAVSTMHDCHMAFLKEQDRSKEPAETIATGALGACQPQEDRARSAFVQVLVERGATRTTAETEASRHMATQRQRIRESLIGTILRQRTGH